MRTTRRGIITAAAIAPAAIPAALNPCETMSSKREVNLSNKEIPADGMTVFSTSEEYCWLPL